MALTLRWSEKDLQKHLSRHPDVSRTEATDTAQSTKRKKPAVSRVERAIESLRLSKITATQVQGTSLDITLDGAVLLSANELYALHHFQRIAYRKACHEIIHLAVLLATGGPRHLTPFERYRVIAHRTAPRGADLDALPGYFKYAIDGLRYCRVLVDDSPLHMIDLTSTQSRGCHRIHLRVERVYKADNCQVATSPSSSLGRCVAGMVTEGRHPEAG